MYITEIIVHNFQSHKHTEVKLSQGLNIFVGENDQGKTALAKRAIQWCLFNEPQGNDFVRFKENGKTNKKGEPERENLCYVTIRFDNGVEVTRKREKGKNYYQLVDETGEVFNFESFGNTVPEEIQRAIGVMKLKVDDDIQLNLNIIGAKDRSLIYESNNYKSKVIGSFAGTNVIDVTIRGIQADMRNISADIKTIEKDIEEIDKEIAEMGDMEKKEEIIDQIDNLYFSLSEELFLKEELLHLNQSIKERKTAILKDKEVVERLKGLEELEGKLQEFESLVNEAEKLMTLRNRLTHIHNRINERKKVIEEAKKVIQKHKNLEKEELELTKQELLLNDTHKKIQKTNNTKKTLLGILERMKAKKQSIKEAKKKLEKYKDVDKKEKELLSIQEKLADLYDTIKQTIDTRNQLTRIQAEIEKKLEIRAKGQAYIRQKEKEISQLIDDCVENIVQLGKCPTCMSDLDSSHVDRIRNELINL